MDEVQNWLANQHSQMRNELIELANQNTGSNNIDGLSRTAKWLENWMDLPNASFQSIALPNREEMDDSGEIASFGTGPLLRWDCRPNAKQRILLAIHYDTVFPVDSHFQACVEDSTEKISGPGTADAKGGILVIRYALQAFERFCSEQGLGWTTVLNPDEEIGSPHSVDYLQSIAPEFSYGLLFEPALPTGELVSTRKGSGNYSVCIRGKAAHAGRHFHDGRNAVAQLCHLFQQLDNMNGQRDGTTINVAQVVGGGAANIVPDLAVGRLNVRMNDQASVEWFEKAIRRMTAQVEQQDGYSAQLLGKVYSAPKVVTPQLEHLMHIVEKSAAAVAHDPIRWIETGGVCDGNKLAAAGLPNIDTLGPIGGGLHSASEWVQTSSIPIKARLVVQLLQHLACEVT